MNSPEKSSENFVGAVICGAYGFENLGDDAILAVLIRQLREENPGIRICVLSKNPEQTKRAFGVDAIPMLDFRSAGRVLRKSGLYVSGGGSLLQNVTSSRSLLFYLASMVQAKRCGCRVVLYGCGIGPIRGRLFRRLTAEILNRCADAVTLRDSGSAALLKEIGVQKQLYLTADPALTIRPDREAAARFLAENGVNSAGNYALFLLRPWKSAAENSEAFHRAAAYVWRKYGLAPAFLPMSPREDTEFAENLAETLEIPHILLPACGKPEVFCGIVAQMRLVVSMRLHGLIFAFGQRIPAVGISYDPKVSGFLEDTGNSVCVELEQLSAETLCACMDEALNSPVTDPEPFRAKAEENARFLRMN